MSLDKYLSADVWSQIYKKLEANGEKDDTISLSRAQLELDVSCKTFRSYQKEVARLLKGKSCDSSCEKVLMVKVRMVSALDKYKRRHGLEKTAEKKSTESINGEPSTSGSAAVAAVAAATAATESRSSNGSTSQPQSQNVEEYVPEPVTDVSSNLDYTPSTLSKKQLSEVSINLNSIENVAASPLDHVHDDVYTPSQKTGSNDSLAITYTPTKIAHAHTSQSTDLNRNDCTEKKTKRIKSKHKMANIFGDADSGDEIDKDSKIGLRRDLRSTPSTPKQQGRLDGWVSRRPKRQDAKTDCDRVDNKRKIRKIGTNERSDGIRKDMNEAEKLRYLREQFEQENANNADMIGEHQYGHM